MPAPGRVDFYILPAASDAARLRFACRLAEKAYHMDKSVHLHTDSAEVAAKLDELLWTFRQGSFVPHEMLGETSAGDAPVTIGFGAAPGKPADLLINLTETVPAFAHVFERIAEIIEDSESARSSGRERFRHYKESGSEPATHKIGTR